MYLRETYCMFWVQVSFRVCGGLAPGSPWIPKSVDTQVPQIAHCTVHLTDAEGQPCFLFGWGHFYELMWIQILSTVHIGIPHVYNGGEKFAAKTIALPMLPILGIRKISNLSSHHQLKNLFKDTKDHLHIYENLFTNLWWPTRHS